ncbi:TonB-dependent outer membrane receptor, SusC/RagA subfamily, signature region [Algoriphagus locisalis]|uniref:TonB-dependent outer membrane receptor, SusC/RagA subfamily, signature region n=1 Tax=Algoriphagus locisalis TaxID=305507 RepID=A0A1I7D680_9BACT|nr:TonB-dependent receptor plug domain-containing protein [Algoriphagus locisalis]SFU07243.1 TonB-dependent outer membrane receptor, SusC/RagA subfamily, signature region [Algoriphagus locisalis]
MKIHLILLTLILSVTFLRPASAQDEIIPQIQTFFDTYQKEFPVEKAYLHLDKSTYTLGEDLWFSAYLTAGSAQVPSPLSSTLYVDLFDGDGLLLEQKIVRLEKGRGSGDFVLPAFGKAGIYQIKAYTAWMRNFGEEYFSTSIVNVIDGAGGSFLPKITFSKISASQGKVTYSSNLTAVDSKGNPLSGKTIDVKALAEGEEVYSQEVTLNADGEVNFTFSIPEKANLSQYLEFTYFESENYAVTQKLRLPYSLTLADIQFLPEGGHAVVDKKSNFAFRALYPDGLPAAISGSILGSEVAFESNFAGLGKFELIPEGKSHQAKIIEKTTGQEVTVNLPEIDESGLVMQVVNNPAAGYLTVFVQGDYNPNALLLVSQTRGIINYMIKGVLSNGTWGVRIPKENLISGINEITVLSADGTPLLQRLIYFQQDDLIDFELSKSGNISKREKINLSLVASVSGAPTSGKYSVSVLDADQVDPTQDTGGNILSSLLLTSDLRGGIYQAGKYFSDSSQQNQEDLDLVMLTHGWRRFSWQDVMSSTFPKIDYFIEQGLNVEGQVTDSGDTKKGLAGGKITALVGEGIEMVTSEFGPNGRFLFKDLNYLDSASLTITAEDNRLKNFVDVELDLPEPVFSNIPGKYSASPLWSADLAATYEARFRMNQLINGQDKLMDLEGVTVESTTIKEEEEQVRKVYGAGDVTLEPDKIPGSVGFNNIFELIQGRVSGVQVSLAGPNVSITIRGVGTLGGASTEPLFLLDNVPTQASTLFNVNPRDVESIDVFKDPASTSIFGVQGGNGVIAIYTKTGAAREISVGGTLVSRVGGYAVPREFYLPKYDTKTVENAMADERATVYWNPLVTLDDNGETNLEFFNTDLAKRLVIVVEGMDESGRLGRLVRVLE